MKKNIYIILFVTAFTLSFTGVRAGEEAVFNKLEKYYTLHADGSQETRVRKELKLLSPMSFNKLYGETFIVYDPSFQSLKINESYTIQADGTIIKTPENAFNEVLPSDAANAPAYNHLKEMVVTHTGVEIGTTIILDYTLTSKANSVAWLDVDELLQEVTPVKEYTATIRVPEGVKLKVQFSGAKAKYTCRSEEGTVTYQWKLKQIAAASHEPYLPENDNNIPRLTATTCPSLEDAFTFLSKSFSSPSSTALKKLALKVTEKAKTDEEKCNALHRYVVSQIDYSPLSLLQTNYSLRTPEQVVQSAYGTQGEKIRLFASLLSVMALPYQYITVYPGTLSSTECGLKPIKAIYLQAGNRYYSLLSLSEPAFMRRGSLDTFYSFAASSATPTEIKVDKDAESVEQTENDTLTEKHAFKEGYLVYMLPGANSGVASWNMSRLNRIRKEILELPYPTKEKCTWTIILAPGMTLESATNETVIKSSVGSLRLSVTQKENTVTVIREIDLSKQQITPEEYPSFRKIMIAWYSQKGKTLLIKKDK